MYESLDIARHILWLRQGEQTTHLHLQKLLYLCHGWVLGASGDPLIRQPEMAWDYGPVEVDVYRHYRDRGADPLTDPAEAQLSPASLARYIERVEHAYRSYGPWDLVRITHQPGSPWLETVQQFGYGHGSRTT